jgi:hypothetical protein
MPIPRLATWPQLRLGGQSRPELSASMQSCMLSQRDQRAAWLATVDLSAARALPGRSSKRPRRGVVISEFETDSGGPAPTTEWAKPSPEWIEGRVLQEGNACELLFDEALLFAGKVVSVTLRLTQEQGPVVQLMCKGSAPVSGRSDAIPKLQHGAGLRQAQLSFTTASPARVRIQGSAEGAGHLRPGGKIELADLGSAFGGRYRLDAVSWRWDVDVGITTDFEARRIATSIR